MPAPSVVVFDVNETLSDMGSMSHRFEEVGAPGHHARTWFASLLRDGFALTAAGASQRFADLAEGSLRLILSEARLARPLDEAVDHLMGGFLDLPVHPDVPDGVRALAGTGMRLVTLTNGSVAITERLLSSAGIVEHFERLLSVEDAGVWKPAAGAYIYASRACAVEPSDMLMVAVHPWDIDGARRAGMRTAWVNRGHGPYPGYLLPATHTVTHIGQLAATVG